jgi:hypothetical protein
VDVEVFHTASPIQDVEKFSRAAALAHKVRANSIEGNEVLRIGSLTMAERLSIGKRSSLTRRLISEVN